MKLNSLYVFCCAALLLCACSKKDSPTPSTPPPVSGGRTQIRLLLGGELTTGQSTLPNGKTASPYVAAKTLQDSTIYAVDVRVNGNTPYAAGVFNNLDSLQSVLLQVNKGATYSINAAVFKKGTGAGLYYTLVNGQQQFASPLNRYMENKLSYTPTDVNFLQNMFFFETFSNDSVIVKGFGHLFSPYPELDSYFGTASVNVTSDSVPQVTLPMRRFVFGFKYEAENFTGGTLLLNYNGAMDSKSYTPETIGNSLSIYTFGAYATSDTYSTWEAIQLNVKWLKPDGSLVDIGAKMFVPPARGYQTIVKITLPTTSTTVNNSGSITVSDSAWTSSQNVNF
jgi:hypothetical protein